MTDLKITQQAIEDQQIQLTVEVPDQRVEKAMRSTARRLAKQIHIPGFRRGKAPYHVIVGRFGRETILEEVAEELGQDVYKEALEAVDIDPYATAELKDITFDPLTYQIVVPMPPEVDAQDYRNLRITFQEPGEDDINAAFEKQIEDLRKDYKTWVPVERPAAYDDMVTISIKVTVNEEVVLDNDDWDIVPSEENYTLAPEFDAALTGMSAGESKRLTVNFPEDGDSPWVGEQGDIEVEVKSIKSEELPALDDEFAQDVGEYETFAELEAQIRENVAESLSNDAETAYRREVLEAMVERASVSYPIAALEREIDMVASEQENIYRMYGIESVEELLRMQGRTAEEYREDLRPGAKSRLERNLVLDAIAAKEEFPVSDYELEQFFSAGVGDDPESLESLRQRLVEDTPFRDYIISLIQRDKAEKLIIDIAKGKEIPAPGEHLAEQAPEVPETTLDEEVPAEQVISTDQGVLQVEEEGTEETQETALAAEETELAELSESEAPSQQNQDPEDTL